MSARGERPIMIPKPDDGIYWIKIARPVYVPHTGTMDEPCNGYHTWDNYSYRWEILQIYGGVDWMGSDEARDPWMEDDPWDLPIQLGPRIVPPEY